jgi:hypothetical protein
MNDIVNLGVVAAFCTCFILMFAFGLTMTACSCSPDEEKFTVNLASPEVVAFQGDPEDWWDATIRINKITPKDYKVLWKEVRIIIKSADGTVLDIMSPLVSNNPDNYYLSHDAEFWYIDGDHDRKVSTGDAFKITNINLYYEGATVELAKGGERIGSITLPMDFP